MNNRLCSVKLKRQPYSSQIFSGCIATYRKKGLEDRYPEPKSYRSLGGFKEIISLIEGERVYSQLKCESGVYRVQRAPERSSLILR